jgi:beta-lactamase regulating signal transducer with metallopeptidase domain
VSTHLLLEAALRTLVMGAIIFIALRLLRIEQVRARRTAWLLALAGALAMPLLVAAHIGPPLLPEISFAKQPVEASQSVAAPSFAGSGLQLPPVGAPDSHWLDRGPSSETSATSADGNRAEGLPYGDTVLTLAVIGYCLGAAVLTLRLCAGLGFALRLRNQAERVIFPFDPELDTRASARLATPVTIGSSVLLPKSFTLWDGATLRIVLAHERAHVRQKDFYVHLLARAHCALFWFNPFSWWLQRQLSELGEAMSDCAAVQHAESRTSYAETLLAFATRDHSPLTGVAMASASNLTPRIERLLSDRRFERSFAPKQRLPIIAAGVVLLALLAATSTVRVNAAPNAAATPSPAAIPSAAPADIAPNVRPAKKKVVKVKKDVAEENADDFDAGNFVTDEEVDRIAKEAADGEVLAIRSGDSHIMINTGRFFGLHAPSGDYIYFQHGGKPYLIQDPKIIAQAQALLAPSKEIREKQRELGNEQRILGEQERMLASQERALSRESAIKMLETPEFKRDMEDLRKRLKEIDLPQITAQIDERALADVQAHLAEIQSRVGRMQFQIGFKGQSFSDMGKFGEQMGKLGEQQEKLGEEQRKLGEQQRKIIEDATRQLKPIIEQSVREGAATPIAK